jgi:hypothetical protein
MDKYSGGDLIDGLHLHWKQRGKVNCYSAVHVCSQMGASVQYLHKRSIVHRDIKGDNYLMDRKDIVDPQCHIALTDFGTATNLAPNERLSAEVGTKIFWAPEVFAKSYGLKVDVWAMGVTMYGLLDGHFPFKDEAEIMKKHKQVKFPRVDPDCEDYLRAMLVRDEEERISAEAIMSHKWIKGEGIGNEKNCELPGNASSLLSTDLEEGTPRGEGNMRDAVNLNVHDRRRELVDRLQIQQEAAKQPKGEKKAEAQHFLAKWFTVADKRLGTTLRFEWWDEPRVRNSGVLVMEGMQQQAEEVSGDLDRSPETVGQALKDCNIDITKFGIGNAKTLEQLASEVHSGAARLMLDASNYKKIVRVVDIVLLRLYATSSKEGTLLVETAEQYPNGNRRETLRIPGAKKQPQENSKEVAQRVLKDFLNMGEVSVHFDFETKESYEEEIDSPSFPGVTTVYRKEIVQCYVNETNTELLTAIGLPKEAPWSAEESNHQMRYLSWMTEKEALSKNVKLRAEGSEEVSGLVMAPIGFSETNLTSILERNGIDVTPYGKAPAISIKSFSEELIRGESSLMQGGNGSLVRVVDSVHLKLVNPAANEMLVQTEQVTSDGNKVALEALPSVMRRPDENQFLTAKRILRRHLKIDENRVKLNGKSVRFFQTEKELTEYPGITTVFRKRVISARLKGSKGD